MPARKTPARRRPRRRARRVDGALLLLAGFITGLAVARAGLLLGVLLTAALAAALATRRRPAPRPRVVKATAEKPPAPAPDAPAAGPHALPRGSKDWLRAQLADRADQVSKRIDPPDHDPNLSEWR